MVLCDQTPYAFVQLAGGRGVVRSERVFTTSGTARCTPEVELPRTICLILRSPLPPLPVPA